MSGLNKINTDVSFVKNKYLKWYVAIVNRAINRKILGYIERHHIFPKSCGGTDDKENIVELTAREHLVCHLLLRKCAIGEYKKKMTYAIFCMTVMGTEQRRAVVKNSRLYEIIKKEMALFISEQSKEWFTNEMNREKLILRNKKISESFINGKRDEYLKWLSNGGSSLNDPNTHKKTMLTRKQNGTNIFVYDNPMKKDGVSKQKKIEKTSGVNHYYYNKYHYYVSSDFGETWECMGNIQQTRIFIKDEIKISMSSFYNIMKDPNCIKIDKFKHLRFKKEKNENKES